MTCTFRQTDLISASRYHSAVQRRVAENAEKTAKNSAHSASRRFRTFLCSYFMIMWQLELITIPSTYEKETVDDATAGSDPIRNAGGGGYASRCRLVHARTRRDARVESRVRGWPGD